ncbi:hypothetical protein HNY73_003680 [Argiope bruennichi]|uniref:Uncharacterized protein n=1 Tax=Argiope bruennichi TaxID=94029 RepID=A0A8T0FQV3_ARGBR|nr:hypothetical protein HNY73_003680 [Argiope bruennichi]
MGPSVAHGTGLAQCPTHLGAILGSPPMTQDAPKDTWRRCNAYNRRRRCKHPIHELQSLARAGGSIPTSVKSGSALRSTGTTCGRELEDTFRPHPRAIRPTSSNPTHRPLGELSCPPGCDWPREAYHLGPTGERSKTRGRVTSDGLSERELSDTPNPFLHCWRAVLAGKQTISPLCVDHLSSAQRYLPNLIIQLQRFS